MNEQPSRSSCYCRFEKMSSTEDIEALVYMPSISRCQYHGVPMKILTVLQVELAVRVNSKDKDEPCIFD